MTKAPSWNDDIEREVASYQGNMTPLAKSLSRITNRAIDGLISDVRAMMERGRYADQPAAIFLNGFADSATIIRMQALLKAVPERYRETIWKSITGQIAHHRMTNIRAIRTLARLNCYAVLDDMLYTTARILSEVAKDGYYRGTFVLQKETGMGWAVDAIKGGRVQVIVDSVFDLPDARRYMDPLVDFSSKTVINSMLRGLPPDMVSKSVDDIKGAMRFRSKREARTVITETAGEAHMEAYKKHGVKQYEFIATWDERTCPVCGRLDGQVFDRDDATVGVNYPPMHPNCRCTTVAKIDPELEALMRQRRYTDDATGVTHEIPRNFGYKDWYETFGPGRKDGVAYRPKFKKKD